MSNYSNKEDESSDSSNVKNLNSNEKERPSDKQGTPGLVRLDKRITPPRAKAFQSRIQAFVGVSHEEYSTCTYSITIVFPGCTAKQSWESVNPAIEKLKILFNHYLTAYAVVGIEMHRSTNKSKKTKIKKSKVDLVDYAEVRSAKNKPKKQKPVEPKTLQELLNIPLEGAENEFKDSNQEELPDLTTQEFINLMEKSEEPSQFQSASPNPLLCGHAHVHVLLSFYNNFMAPTENKILEFLLDLGFIDCRVSTLRPGTTNAPRFDVKQSFLYVIKEGRDVDLSKYIKKRFNIKDLTHIYYGLSAIEPSLRQVAIEAYANKIPVTVSRLESIDKLPYVEQNTNTKTTIAMFFKRLLERNKLKLFKNSEEIWERVPSSELTYANSRTTLTQAYFNMWDTIPEPSFLNILQESSNWILSQAKLGVFPILERDRHLLELKDCVFDSRTCRIYSKSVIKERYPDISCFNYIDMTFNDIVFPKECLDAIGHCFENPFQAIPTYLASFGALHKSDSLIKKGLYLFGPPGSGKSLLSAQLLSEIYDNNILGRVESAMTSFQFGDLVDSHIWVFNDFFPDQVNMSTCLQLVEGEATTVQVKYSKSQEVKGDSFIFSSNDDLGAKIVVRNGRDYPVPGFDALKRRVTMLETKKTKNSNDLLKRETFKKLVLDNTWGLYLFGIICNAVFERRLLSNDDDLTALTIDIDIPSSWVNELSSAKSIYYLSTKAFALIEKYSIRSFDGNPGNPY